MSYYSLSFISIGNWTSLLNVGIILAVPLARVWLKQPMYTIQIICCIISFIGVIIIVKPDIIFGESDDEYNTWQYVGLIGFTLTIAVEFNCYSTLKETPVQVILVF
eukprot:UN04675